MSTPKLDDIPGKSNPQSIGNAMQLRWTMVQLQHFMEDPTYQLFVAKSTTFTYLLLMSIKSYDAVDTNPFHNYIFKPLYYKLATYIPKSIAPNVITSGTFLLTLSQYLILAYYDYYFFADAPGSPEEKRVPNWIWLYSYICMALIILFDSIDGKHARDTGNSSPVGEIFDHSVDGWRMLAPIICCFFSLYGRDEMSLYVVHMTHMVLAAQFVAIVIIWQQYLTKTICYDWGSEILQYYMAVFYFAKYLSNISGYHQIADCFFNATACMMERYYIFVLFAIAGQLVFFFKRYSSCPVNLNNGELYRPMTGLLVQALASLFWLHYSQNQIMEHDPRAFTWLTSIVCSNLLFRLLIHMMTNTTPHLTTWFLNVYIFVIISTVLTPISLGLELWIVRIMAILATLYHVHYITSLVRQMSRHLGIKIFTVRKTKQK